MDFRYQENQKIKNLIREVEELRIVITRYPSLPHIENNLRRESLLNSALFSAKIEGITNAKPSGKLEIQNLHAAYKYLVSTTIPKHLTIKFIFDLHKQVLRNISTRAGKLRNEPWEIFNQAGIAIYLAPAHFKLPELMA